jgi:hypothetical protein
MTSEEWVLVRQLGCLSLMAAQAVVGLCMANVHEQHVWQFW